MGTNDSQSDADWLPQELARKAEWLPAQCDRPEGMYVSVGGNIGRTKAGLRLFGEDLEPSEITALLGCMPTASYRKGEPVVSGGRGVRSRGCWRLESRLDETHGIDAHVGDILGRVTDDAGVWRSLARFNPDIFVGLFLSSFNQGDSIAPRTLQLLAVRGIRLDFDIYSAPRD